MKSARIIFSIMVPITLIAFVLGSLTVESAIDINFTFTVFDGVKLF